MTVAAPRLEIDLRKLHHNARSLVERLGTRCSLEQGLLQRWT